MDELKNNIHDDEIDLIAIIIEILRHRLKIILSVFIFSLIGIFYSNYTAEIFTTNATLQVSDNQSDPSSFINDNQYQFLFNNNINNEDQISVFTSSLILGEVVDDLNLNIKYYKKNIFKQDEQITKDSLPFSIVFKNPIQNTNYAVDFGHKNVTVRYENKEFSFSTNKGTFENNYFKYILNESNKLENNKYRIVHLEKNDIINEIKSKYSVTPLKNSNTYNLSYSGTNKNLNYKILEGIVSQLKKNNVEEKKKIYRLSISFVESRILNIEKKIDSLNFLISNYKVSNNFFDPDAQSKTELTNLFEIDNQIFNNSIQIELSTKLLRELKKQEKFKLLPTDIGIENKNINNMVNLNNNIIIEKNNLIIDATEQNPLIIQYQNQLSELRSNILNSLNIYIDKLKTKSTIFNDQKQKRNSQVNLMPVKEAELKNLERDILIQNNLHTYLSQKKEEALISISSLTSNIDLINEVDYLISRESKMKFLLVFPLFGIVFSIGVIFLLFFLRTFFINKDFLEENLKNVNFLGIVRYEKNINSQDHLNFDSFKRILYNIKAQFQDDKKSGISIMITSCLKNEGKTYTAYNFSKYLSNFNKKTILVGTDIRNPDLSKFYETKIEYKKGLSNIISKNDDYKSLVNRYKFQQDNFDTLFVGTKNIDLVEVFNSEKFNKIISYLKSEYDYVIFDTAPFLVMIDSLELFNKSDYIINVFRNNYSPKKTAKYFKEHIKKYNLENVGYIIIDDTKHDKFIDKYAYKYGYGYGYGYGYDLSNYISKI